MIVNKVKTELQLWLYTSKKSKMLLINMCSLSRKAVIDKNLIGTKGYYMVQDCCSWGVT
ncbi:hypothetical protein ACFLUJ_08485 [Chloroflexota bacterium]